MKFTSFQFDNDEHHPMLLCFSDLCAVYKCSDLLTDLLVRSKFITDNFRMIEENMQSNVHDVTELFTHTDRVLDRHNKRSK